MSTTIERVIPLVGHLPASLREALGRRLRELAGFGLVGIAGVAVHPGDWIYADVDGVLVSRTRL